MPVGWDFEMLMHRATTLVSSSIGSMSHNWAVSFREIASKADLRDYWIRISSSGDFLTTVPSYTHIKEPLRRLCHRLMVFSIAERGEAPKKDICMSLYCTSGSALRINNREPSDIDCGEMGPERPQVGVADEAAQIDPNGPEGAVVHQEGVQADSAPANLAQIHLVAASAPPASYRGCKD
uniref:Uncharacterized protein n=1 Tax=Tanacetum cinerariifolium TaxID=118510 RepID=A0A6L2M918_TANCI|nr:hypothetical protein [Tanacetum cinerariifolium]